MENNISKCTQCLYAYKDIKQALRCAHTEIKSIISHGCEACHRFVDRSKYYD